MALTKPLFIALGLTLSGCGTINTVVRGDDVTARNLKQWRTHCASVPRIYSGAVYNFCILNGEPNATVNDPAAPVGIPFVIWDIALSGALDTVALPYTIFRQIEDGNIELGR